MLIGHYNGALILFSVLVAILASYTALDMAARVTTMQGQPVRWWLVCREELPWPRSAGGALLMGAGMAGMHYTGVAAMRMAMRALYTPSLVILSLLIAVGALRHGRIYRQARNGHQATVYDRRV
jgi:NO-binding membrane sensor protein with MHYT domain